MTKRSLEASDGGVCLVAIDDMVGDHHLHTHGVLALHDTRGRHMFARHHRQHIRTIRSHIPFLSFRYPSLIKINHFPAHSLFFSAPQNSGVDEWMAFMTVGSSL